MGEIRYSASAVCNICHTTSHRSRESIFDGASFLICILSPADANRTGSHRYVGPSSTIWLYIPAPRHKVGLGNTISVPSRLETISRTITRNIRHGQRPSGWPPLPISPRREIYILHIKSRPIFPDMDSECVDFSRIATDVDQPQKRRDKIKFAECTPSYLVGVYCGWSSPVEMDPWISDQYPIRDTTPIPLPWEIMSAFGARG